jgi:hypothetical protein
MAEEKNVKVKLTRRGLEGTRDAVVSVTERRARQLIQHRPALAVPFTGDKKMDKSLLENKMEEVTENKSEIPLVRPEDQPGSPAGKAQPSSSSPEGQAPKALTSKKLKGKSA